MSHQIKTFYVIHHSHTDIGYTDLQERVLENQANYIHTVLKLMESPENREFRWNCETLFCVEEFFKSASQEEKEQFFRLAAEGKLGMSANYLNFTDLLDTEIYKERLAQWQAYFRAHGFAMNTAMFADINGISMGCRDAMIDNGVEFLYTNIHCHHGMYPLRQNQNAYFWENAQGKRLLVWNGEHYNLGNALGVRPNVASNYMCQNYLGKDGMLHDPVEELHDNLDRYLTSCETQGYPYDFNITSVSGVFSDNAPPELEILRVIQEYNRRYGQETQLKMVSLQELYAEIRDKLANAPVYHGDLTDWWANGVGSTPYAVKHYREAQHRYQLCSRLDPKAFEKYPELARTAQDNLILYAEHTWGHSSTITNPYDTMVLNLDMRKNSYASKAHEASSLMLGRIAAEKGDILRYYSTNGSIRVCNPSSQGGVKPVEFYIETCVLDNAEIRDAQGNVIPCQISDHPRGRRISFTDTFAPHEEKSYTYRQLPKEAEPLNTRQCYVGAERIRDIVNSYDPETYTLPYGFENDFFRLSYRPHVGVTSFVDKRTGREMLGDGEAPFFTPMYQRTAILANDLCPVYEDRRLLGRNIRGQHAELYIGRLETVSIMDRGPVFTQLRLSYSLEGTVHADVILKFYAALPRVDFRLELGKTISSDIESVFLPLSLRFRDSSLYLRKGVEAFRPGVDQLPGACMEFYMSDQGLSYVAHQGGALIAFPDTPLVYFGSMSHHPIRLCEGKEEDNHRPVYSWIMNNNWETNFKMDLSGFCEFNYSLWLTEEQKPEAAMDELRENTFDPYVLIVE